LVKLLATGPPIESLADGLQSTRSLAIAMLVLSATFIADGLRDALEPRSRNELV
jgi:hypothetical protein